MSACLYLYEDEMELVTTVIPHVLAGRYRLIDLFQDLWELVWDKRGFGRRFKRSVEDGLIPGFEIATKTIVNHQTYNVRPRH